MGANLTLMRGADVTLIINLDRKIYREDNLLDRRIISSGYEYLAVTELV
jgi:hypothetical protein